MDYGADFYMSGQKIINPIFYDEYNHVIEEHNVYIKALRNIKNNEQLVVYFDGFFQSEKYFLNCSQSIKDELKLNTF